LAIDMAWAEDEHDKTGTTLYGCGRRRQPVG
jgi:hypothetical protein